VQCTNKCLITVTLDLTLEAAMSYESKFEVVKRVNEKVTSHILEN